VKKLTDITNDNVKKISIIEHETKEVSNNSFIILLNLSFISIFYSCIDFLFGFRKSYDQWQLILY